MGDALREACEEIADLKAKLATAREALETYAQFDAKGELAMVSGFLAARALKEIDSQEGTLTDLAWMRPKLAELCGLNQKYKDDDTKIYQGWYFVNGDRPYCYVTSWYPEYDTGQALRCLESLPGKFGIAIHRAVVGWSVTVSPPTGPIGGFATRTSLATAACLAIAAALGWENK